MVVGYTRFPQVLGLCCCRPDAVQSLGSSNTTQNHVWVANHLLGLPLAYSSSWGKPGKDDLDCMAATGMERFRVLRVLQQKPVLMCLVEILDDDEDGPAEVSLPV